jgi:hypothetical protein
VQPRVSADAEWRPKDVASSEEGVMMAAITRSSRRRKNMQCIDGGYRDRPRCPDRAVRGYYCEKHGDEGKRSQTVNGGSIRVQEDMPESRAPTDITG